MAPQESGIELRPLQLSPTFAPGPPGPKRALVPRRWPNDDYWEAIFHQSLASLSSRESERKFANFCPQSRQQTASGRKGGARVGGGWKGKRRGEKRREKRDKWMGPGAALWLIPGAAPMRPSRRRPDASLAEFVYCQAGGFRAGALLCARPQDEHLALIGSRRKPICAKGAPRSVWRERRRRPRRSRRARGGQRASEQPGRRSVDFIFEV